MSRQISPNHPRQKQNTSQGAALSESSCHGNRWNYKFVEPDLTHLLPVICAADKDENWGFGGSDGNFWASTMFWSNDFASVAAFSVIVCLNETRLHLLPRSRW